MVELLVAVMVGVSTSINVSVLNEKTASGVGEMRSSFMAVSRQPVKGPVNEYFQRPSAAFLGK